MKQRLCQRRICCRLHMLNRVQERRIDLSAAEIRLLEGIIERMRQAFEAAGRGRYKLKIKRPSENIIVVYDTRLNCLVSAWAGRPRVKPKVQHHE